MLILGLLLLVAVALLTLGLLVGNTSGVSADVFGYTLPKLTVGEFFVLGVFAGVVGLLALLLTLSGMRRNAQRRRQLRLERKEKQRREAELKEENARLARELEQQQRAQATGGPAAATSSAQTAPAPSPGPDTSPSAGSSRTGEADPASGRHAIDDATAAPATRTTGAAESAGSTTSASDSASDARPTRR